MVNQAREVVKIAERWLEPTTPDQCGENPVQCSSSGDYFALGFITYTCMNLLKIKTKK